MFGLQKIFFDLKWALEMSLIAKWGPGGKIVWYIIQYYFEEFLTPMLTLGPRLYRSSNLVLHLKMWEKIGVKSPCVALVLFSTKFA